MTDLSRSAHLRRIRHREAAGTLARLGMGALVAAILCTPMAIEARAFGVMGWQWAMVLGLACASVWCRWKSGATPRRA